MGTVVMDTQRFHRSDDANLYVARREERNREDWAEMMVGMGGRACVVAQLTSLPDSEVRSIWQRKIGRSSPSGQQPNDPGWYLKSPLRRYHSALLVVLYSQCVKQLPAHAAFGNAFYHYARVTAGLTDRDRWEGDPAFRASEKDYVIPFSRGHFLTSFYSDETTDDGRRLCELQIRRCKKCQALYMAHSLEAGSVCPSCS